MAPVRRALKYVDLTLDIREGADGEYNVTAFSENNRMVHGKLTLPFKLEELAGVIHGVSETIRGATPAMRAAVLEAPSGASAAPAPGELGVKLYESLFSRDIHSLFDELLVSVGSQNDGGIRIRLSFDIKGRTIPQVASLPWELLARDASQEPLALSRQTVLVRSLDSGRTSRPIPFERPLRILVVLSNPTGTASLNLNEERERITQEWARLKHVEVTILGGGNPDDEASRPTPSNLRRLLANEDFHVVHFMGHGDFDAETGLGVLLLENDDRSPCPVTGEKLWTTLQDERTLRLVFLNACKTAATGAPSAGSPFAGIADALIRGGVPAVVAMQYPISDRAAILFAKTFYQSIVDGHPVDAAVAEGRKELQGPSQSAFVQREWFTPVLFMQPGDGMLFTGMEATGTYRTSAPSAPGAAPSAPVVVTPTASAAPAPPSAPAPARSGGGFGVFLASANATRVRDAVATELKKAEGVQVITDTPASSVEHAAAVRALGESTDWFVHLMDENPGEPIIDDDKITYPWQELKIGLQSARSQLVVMPEGLTIDSRQFPDYAAFIESLHTLPYEEDRFEFARLPRQQIPKYIVDKQKLVEKAAKLAASRVGGPISSVYVDVHMKDEQNAKELVEYLSKQVNLQYAMDRSDDGAGAGAAPSKLFAAQVENNPLCIIVFGEVDKGWVAKRLEKAMWVVANSGAPTQICVYVAPPVKGKEQWHFVRNYRHAVGMEKFDAGSVDALMKAASEIND